MSSVQHYRKADKQIKNVIYYFLHITEDEQEVKIEYEKEDEREDEMEEENFLSIGDDDVENDDNEGSN